MKPVNEGFEKSKPLEEEKPKNTTNTQSYDDTEVSNNCSFLKKKSDNNFFVSTSSAVLPQLCATCSRLAQKSTNTI